MNLLEPLYEREALAQHVLLDCERYVALRMKGASIPEALDNLPHQVMETQDEEADSNNPPNGA